MRRFKIIVERHPDGYVAYPLGLKGVVIGDGESYEAAVANVESAIAFHIATFGPGIIDTDSPVMEVLIGEARVAA